MRVDEADRRLLERWLRLLDRLRAAGVVDEADVDELRREAIEAAGVIA